MAFGVFKTVVVGAIAFAVIGTGGMAAGTGQAHAQSCNALKTQLAAARRGGGDVAIYRQYAEAAQSQARELIKTERYYHRQGCSRSGAPQCHSIGNTIEQMRANLDRLERTRDAYRPAANQREVRRLQAAIDSACSPQTRTVSIRRDAGSLVPRNAPLQQSQEAERLPSWQPEQPEKPGFTDGNYRTMCVRTCDGYFFPISFATSQASFERDEAVCSALCPAAPTQLFTHRAGDDQGTMSMIALDGTPYTDLEHAFRFQSKGRQPECSCGKARTDLIGIIGVTAEELEPENSEAKTEAAPAALIPRKRPDLAADPETLLNTEHKLTPEKIASIASSVAVGEVYDVADTQDRVRVVGSEFFPDPEEAIDLKAPVPTPFP